MIPSEDTLVCIGEDLVTITTGYISDVVCRYRVQHAFGMGKQSNSLFTTQAILLIQDSDGINGLRFKTEEEYDYDTGKWEKKKKMAGFLALPVYDISQTAGDDLPVPKMPDISGDDGLKFLEAMKDFCKEHGIKSNFLDLKGLGYVGESKGGEIDISTSRSINQQVSTIIHEVAHEYLHSIEKDAPKDKRIRETEAEGVAFVVLSHLGLPTKAPIYIAIHGGTGKTIIDCAENIARVSHVIMSYLTERTCWEL